jgi:diacylglycerol kinase (ATP)
MGIALSLPPRVLIVFNPQAGQGLALRQALDQAAQIWRQQHWQVELQPTREPGDATFWATQAAVQGYDIVVAAGGDGTVNEVANGLVGSTTALAVLPVGTVNIWARELGLPMDVTRSATALLHAQLMPVDLGKAGDRHFLLMAGVGFDAAVTAGVCPKAKKRFGVIAYLKHAFHLAWQWRGVRSLIRIDGRRVRGRILMVVIGNSQLYGGVFKMTAHATIDDGLLDVCVIKGHTLLVAPLRLLSIFTRRYNLDPKVEYYRATRVSIQGKHTLPIQVDGDYLGQTPMTFEVVPAGLWVLVPPSADRSLWQSPDLMARASDQVIAEK